MALCNYQVFLSFRGPDTVENLARFLHDRLTSAGITTFLDRKEIQFGQIISDELIDAIQNSDICVPIFSPDFASSAACLMEVAKMVELGKEIRPIFFFVKPRDVRHQLGTYATSFKEHKRKKHYPESTIQEWKNALKKIAGINGPEFETAALETTRADALKKISAWEKFGNIGKAALKKIGVRKGRDNTKANGGQFYTDLFDGFKKLDDFISDIWKLFKMNEEGVPRNLVGIDRDVPEMMRKLGFYYRNGIVREWTMTGRRVLVVSGMPKVGKTTLAKVVFHKIKHLFHGSSFLEDVRREFEHNSEVSLLNKLIRELKGGGLCQEVKSSVDGTRTIQHMFRNKRVLILLDDVDDVDQFKQIKTLAAGELSWFGEGSAIILTTTKRSVFDFYNNPQTEQDQGNFFNEHEVLPMNEEHALELFYKHAFPPDHPREVYENWSREIIRAVEYLPYAIERVGRHLNGKSDDHWEETLDSLRTRPEKMVRQILIKHFDSLSDHPEARDIFLDIACFFTGVEKTIPNYLWAALEWEPLRNVGLLEDMAFLRKGEENEFSMHNQLKLLGRQIVMNENRENPEGRSRVHDQKDLQKILRQMQGTGNVKALRVASGFNPVDDALFACLRDLRFLELDNVDINGNCENILQSLKWLDWRGCKSKCKLFAFSMEDLVILSLRSSSIHLSLGEWKELMKKAGSLQVLSLKGCTWVNASMEIPASSLLKCLILEGCLHLELKTTNSNFKNLVSFNMKGCKWVNDLPEALRFMEALKELLIDGTKIEGLHFEQGSLPALETLSACHCGELREVTDSIRYLKNLKKLFLRGCEQLNTLPHVFGELGQLQEMDLSDTTISELPPCVKHCKKLQVLKMAHTFIEAFPEAIKNLKKLEELDFTNCGGLSGRCDITGLLSLRILRLEGTEISEVLARDETQFCLHILEIDHDFTKLIPIVSPSSKGKGTRSSLSTNTGSLFLW